VKHEKYQILQLFDVHMKVVCIHYFVAVFCVYVVGTCIYLEVHICYWK